MAQQQQRVVAPVPSVIPAGVPPGLEFLLPTNMIIVQEIKEWGFFSSNYRKQYDIMDCFGRRMFYAAENPAQSGMCGGENRYWTIDILNHMGQPVLSGSRQGGGGCDSNQVYVMSPLIGQQIGAIIQQPNFGPDCWHVCNGAMQPVMFMDSPFFKSGWGHKEFPLLTLQEPRQQIGRISKEFAGLFAREDVFGVEFPVNLDVNIKGVLIYAAFLIDFMYYENYGHH